MDRKKLYMIGNGHLDPVWLWRWEEGFQANKSTFRSVLDRMKEFPDFVFTSSSAQFYRWIEENDPAMFQEIRERVQEGRWVLCGGWWVQPDCNIPCGESYARHALLGQNYFLEKFGVAARTGYNVDSFGHNGMLPQILKKSGMDRYVFMRPGPHEKELPSWVFRWEAPDGSRVTALRIPFSYGANGNLAQHVEACIPLIPPELGAFCSFYGVGNHGGGPTVRNLQEIQDVQREQDAREDGVEVLLGDPDRFFDEIRDREELLPVVKEDLQYHAPGCYSVHSQVKRLNRRAENALLAAEKWSVVGERAGGIAYPGSFTQGWEDVLFNQFHDILAGTSIAPAYFDVRSQLGEALAIAGRNQNNAIQSISSHISIPYEEEMVPVVVFNPHSWEVEAPVVVEPGMHADIQMPKAFAIYDRDGGRIPHQVVDAESKAGRFAIALTAKVGPLGYETFYIRQEREKDPFLPLPSGDFSKGEYWLENQWLHLELDPAAGGIASLTDRETGAELFSAPAAVGVVMEDKSDTWSHGIARYAKEVGRFLPVSIRKVEEGEVRTTVRVVSRYSRSSLVQEFTLYRDRKEVEVKATVNWQEIFGCLKLRFPTCVADKRQATYEIPYGHIRRGTDGHEESMQSWFDLAGCDREGRGCGLAILNDGKYGGDILDNVMHLTVLRSPVYAHHDPFQLEEENAAENYHFIDQGIQTFRYLLLPHGEDWRESRMPVVRRALELNQPVFAMLETFHQHERDRLSSRDSFLALGGSLVMTCLKRAEKLEGYVLRFYEPEGREQQALLRVSLPGMEREVPVTAAPCEIQTLLLPFDSAQPVRPLMLTEWEV